MHDPALPVVEVGLVEVRRRRLGRVVERDDRSGRCSRPSRAASTARSADVIVGPQTTVSSWAVTISVRSCRSSAGSSGSSPVSNTRRPARRTPSAVRSRSIRSRSASAPSARARGVGQHVAGSPARTPSAPSSSATGQASSSLEHLTGPADQAADDRDPGHRDLEQLARDAVPAGGVEPDVGLARAGARRCGRSVPPASTLSAAASGPRRASTDSPHIRKSTSGIRRATSRNRSIRFCRSQRPAQKTCGRRPGRGRRLGDHREPRVDRRPEDVEPLALARAAAGTVRASSSREVVAVGDAPRRRGRRSGRSSAGSSRPRRPSRVCSLQKKHRNSRSEAASARAVGCASRGRACRELTLTIASAPERPQQRDQRRLRAASASSSPISAAKSISRTPSGNRPAGARAAVVGVDRPRSRGVDPVGQGVGDVALHPSAAAPARPVDHDHQPRAPEPGGLLGGVDRGDLPASRPGG